MFSLSKLLLTSLWGQNERAVSTIRSAIRKRRNRNRALKICWHRKSQLSESQRQGVTRIYTLVLVCNDRVSLQWNEVMADIFCFEFSIVLCRQYRRDMEGNHQAASYGQRGEKIWKWQRDCLGRALGGPGVWLAAASPDFPQRCDQEGNPSLTRAVPETIEISFWCQSNILDWGKGGEVGNQRAGKSI